MGCDIHMMVEVKRSINDEEKWVNYDHFLMNPWHGDDDGDQNLIALIWKAPVIMQRFLSSAAFVPMLAIRR